MSPSHTVYTNSLLSSLNIAKRSRDATVSVSLNNVVPPRYPGQLSGSLSGSNNTHSGQVRAFDRPQLQILTATWLVQLSNSGPEITIQRVTESDEDFK